MISKKYVVLCSVCQNDETGEHEAMSAHFAFEDERTYQLHESTFFDDLTTCFNQWLEDNGYPGWRVDDSIEPERFITASEAINPYLIIMSMGSGFTFNQS